MNTAFGLKIEMKTEVKHAISENKSQIDLIMKLYSIHLP